MKEVSFKEIIFDIFSGLAVFWLGIYVLDALPTNLPLWVVLAVAAFLCILARGMSGWFSRKWGWLFGGFVFGYLPRWRF